MRQAKNQDMIGRGSTMLQRIQMKKTTSRTLVSDERTQIYAQAQTVLVSCGTISGLSLDGKMMCRNLVQHVVI
jgi:hypothetical protein